MFLSIVWQPFEFPTQCQRETKLLPPAKKRRAFLLTKFIQNNAALGTFGENHQKFTRQPHNVHQSNREIVRICSEDVLGPENDDYDLAPFQQWVF